MKRTLAVALAIWFAGSCLSSEQLDLRSLARRARPAVVLILGFDDSGKVIRTGSGFFVSADGRLITNWHVIQGVNNAKAKTEDGPVFAINGVLAGSPKLDVAVLQADAHAVPFLEIQRDGPPEAGTRIAVIGSPVALEGTLSEGIVSADRKDKNGNGTWIQITAPVSPGSSGSPVLDEEAKVVGIATLNSGGRYQNINFARSAADILTLLDVIPTSSAPITFARVGGVKRTGDEIIRSWVAVAPYHTTPQVESGTSPPTEPTASPRSAARVNPSKSPARSPRDSVKDLDATSVERAANAGDVNAEVELAFRCMVGCKGFRLDYDKAATWFRKAADKGNTEAQFYLAFMYKEGRGMSEDAGKAAALNEDVAKKGSVTALVALARQYQKGDGMPRDYKKAAKLYLKAAETGRVRPGALADLYAQGRGVPQDYAKAADMYEEAADEWDPFALAKLGDLYRRGKGVSQDYAKSAELCRKSADQGCPVGLAYFGRNYATGKGVPRNYDKAVELFQRGIANGGRYFAEPYRELAWFLATCADDSRRNGKEAMRYASEACDIDEWQSARSIEALAAAYAELGDFEAATRYEKKAQSSGDKDSDPDFEVAFRAFAERKPLRETSDDR